MSNNIELQPMTEADALRMAQEQQQAIIDNEQAVWDRLRRKRNQLLAETDYLALSDQTMSAEMTTYRQALRDITNGLTTVEDVEAVVFPEKPEV